ncbi:MAG: C-GCAxxG-C-C family protein [Candidatus Hodarchaeales archaeon]|jgi:C_GCAxxG_C_C family probable redox protein
MKDIETAVTCFKNTEFNCSQAIISTYGPKFGIDQESCLKISEAFGGGIAYLGSICGAVSGALMVIGLSHGRINDDDLNAKYATLRYAEEFINRFKVRNNTVMCKELLNFEINTEEKLKLAREKKVFDNCAGFVQDAAEIIEELVEIP